MKNWTLDELDKAYEKGRVREEIPVSTLPEMQDDRINVTIEGLENNKSYAVRISEVTDNQSNEDEFLAWLEAYAKQTRREYIECKLSESAKYNAIMITLERVLDKYKEINP